MRPRTLASRKSRPVSVHVTGVSQMGDPSTPPSKAEKPQPSSRPPVIMKKAEKHTKNDIPPAAKTLPKKKVPENNDTKLKSTETTKSKNTVEITQKKGEKPTIDTSTMKRAKSEPKKKSW